MRDPFLVKSSRVSGAASVQDWLSYVLWLAAWALFGFFAAPKQFAMGVLAAELLIHTRVRAPLGEAAPPDLVLACAWSLSLPFAAMSGASAAAEYLAPIPDLHVLACWLLAVAASALAAWLQRCAATSVRISFVRAFPDAGPVPWPGRPLATRFHPFFYWFFRSLPGCPGHPRVVITRVPASGGLLSSVDVWTCGAGPKHCPVFFVVHGGGWKGGDARTMPQAPLLHALAAQGWLVVSCNYRKRRWPEHLDDASAALRWACGPVAAADFGASADRRLVVAGTSAGGHLATLLTLRGLHDQTPDAPKISRVVLFYPAVDPGDRTGITSGCCCSWRCLRAKRGRSLMAWYFETFVLRGSGPPLTDNEVEAAWSSAEPLVMLEEQTGVAARWPPTLVVHGAEDCLVPLEHGKALLSALARPEGGELRGQDTFWAVPTGRHSFEFAPCVVSEAVLDCVLRVLESEVSRQ